MQKSLFLFHRDLRLEDNTGLLEALKKSQEVIPAFILDPDQIEHNSYRGNPALQFMFESLEDLDAQLRQKGGRLYLFYGKTSEVITQLLKGQGIRAIFTNHDYTPFALRRDAKIQSLCQQAGVPFFSFADALLHEPEEVVKQDGKPYTIFTPYFRAASQIPVGLIQKNDHRNYFPGAVMGVRTLALLEEILSQRNGNSACQGGRAEGLKLLEKIQDQVNYAQERDIPALDSITHLSAHHKFGTISVRETYHAIQENFGLNHPLIRELFWRDFFTQIAFHFPHVFGQAFHSKYDSIRWENDESLFDTWCEGKTGFPIVDAGMRQMKQTGFMHNRVRMITASFLIKDLHIDWRKGEHYFAQHLIDYDPAVNNGNWQWAASTGCDAQPYFRIFNPWLQQKKFDPECIYIKRWIPELSNLNPKEIHGWNKKQTIAEYPAPIVDHVERSKRAKGMYKDL